MKRTALLARLRSLSSARSDHALVDGARAATPLLGPGGALDISSRPYSTSPPADRAAPSASWRPPAHRPRSLADWEALCRYLHQTRREFLLRDVYQELSLNGVFPSLALLSGALHASARARRLQDARFFWAELRRRGLQPGEREYTSMVTACGRGGQLQLALALVEEMRAEGVPPSAHTHLALLNSCAELGLLPEARLALEGMRAAGHGGNEFAHAAVLNCFRHMPAQRRPSGARDAVLEGYRAAREEVAAAAAARAAAGAPPVAPSGDGSGVIVLNAAVRALAELGHAGDAIELFEEARAGGTPPNDSTFTAVLACWLQLATGAERQLQGDALTAEIERRLEAMGAATAARATTAPAGGAQADEAGSSSSSSSSDSDSGTNAVASSDSESDSDGEDAGDGGGGRPPAGAAAGAAVPPGRLLRTRVRFQVMAEGLDVAAWDRALELYQEGLDSGVRWGFNDVVALLKASMDLGACGVEDAFEVAHAVLDRVRDEGQFLGGEAGSHLLSRAARRVGGDLEVAHRMWELMRGGREAPAPRAAYKYLIRLEEEGDNSAAGRARRADVCRAILRDLDPGRRPFLASMRAEVVHRLEALRGEGAPAAAAAPAAA